MSSQSSSVPARTKAVLRSLREGLRERGVFYFRRARVVCWNAYRVAEEESSVDAHIGEASLEDLRGLAEAQHCDPTDWIARRGKGNLCIVARSGSTFLGYLWISRGAELMSEVNQVLDVSRDPEGAYLYDGYVLPAHRRKGVLRALLGWSKRWALERGVSRLYAAFARENHESERALSRAGFIALVGDVGIVRVLSREWTWVRVPRGGPVADVLRPVGPDPLPA